MYNHGTIQKMAQAIRNQPLEVFELMLFNNPVSLVNALREFGLTSAIKPTNDEVETVIKRMIHMKDKNNLNAVISHFRYDPSVNNFTTSDQLWNELDAAPGDFYKLFNRIAQAR